jgi:peptidylprolyl isomerase
MVRRSALSAIVAVLLLSGCRDFFSAHRAPDTVQTARYSPDLKVDLKASTTLPSGVVYRDLSVGTGATVADGMQVTVRYVAWLTNGIQIDASPDNDPWVFPLGKHAVIAGWDSGIAGMRVGGRRQLLIPPEQAYGEAGSGTKIGPNTILVFMIEVLDAK